jgi:hypothetical protein
MTSVQVSSTRARDELSEAKSREESYVETLIDADGNAAEFDRSATIRAYAELERGATDTCDCLYCANYTRLRNRDIFPAEMLEVCDRLGIDVLKEGETTAFERPESQMIIYIGELYFVGNVRVGSPTSGVEPSTGTSAARWGFAKADGPRPPDVFAPSVAVVTYQVELPWVLTETPT